MFKLAIPFLFVLATIGCVSDDDFAESNDYADEVMPEFIPTVSRVTFAPNDEEVYFLGEFYDQELHILVKLKNENKFWLERFDTTNSYKADADMGEVAIGQNHRGAISLCRTECTMYIQSGTHYLGAFVYAETNAIYGTLRYEKSNEPMPLMKALWDIKAAPQASNAQLGVNWSVKLPGMVKSETIEGRVELEFNDLRFQQDSLDGEITELSTEKDNVKYYVSEFPDTVPDKIIFTVTRGINVDGLKRGTEISVDLEANAMGVIEPAESFTITSP